MNARSLSGLARRLLGWVALGALVAAVAPNVALAQAPYPSQPIRIIVAAGPGTVGDILARLLATNMSKSLGQPMTVENIPAAGGIVGTQQLVRAPKDGYTLAVLSNNHVINPSIYKNIPFDSIKDIGPIGNIGSTPLVLVTNPSFPANNLRELLALAKAKPGGYTYGSAGNGTVLHLAGVLLTSEADVEMKHVPYKGLAQMTADLLSGQIDMGFAGIATVAGQIKAGKLRALGVSTVQRSPVLPDVPTLAEAGLPNYRFEGWLALVGPAGLPAPIVQRMNVEVKAALAAKDVQDALAAQGVATVGSTPQAAAQFIAAEMDTNAKLVKRSGATLE